MSIEPYTVALLHFEGANHSTTITDETGKVWTRKGTGTVISTDDKVFGDSSLEIATGVQGATTPDHADFAFGSGDFTLEFWIKTTGTTGYSALLYKAVSDTSVKAFSIRRDTGTLELTFTASEDGSAGTLVNAAIIGTLTSGVWSHVAVCRSGTNVYCFLDGVVGSTTAVSTNSVWVTTGLVQFGNSLLFSFAGNIDELRISKGIARWTEDFSDALPDAPYLYVIPDDVLTMPLFQLAI